MGSHANHLTPESYRISECEWVGHKPGAGHPARLWFLKRSEKSRKPKRPATTVHHSAEDCVAAARDEGCPHCVVQPHIQNPSLVLGAKVRTALQASAFQVNSCDAPGTFDCVCALGWW